MRVIAGITILIMYYKNAFWSAYMPISMTLNADYQVDVDKYKTYAPPYYAIANLFVTGGNFIYYTFSVVYVFIRYWRPLKKAFVGMVVNTIRRRSVYTGFEDGHSRTMRRYKEVPEWWVRNLIFILSIIVPYTPLISA
jgi:hypothetical protein